jgi:hypothetical protein
MHEYEVRPRKDKRGVDLVSDALPFGRLWYGDPNAIANAIGYAKFRSPSHRAVIRVYDESGSVIEPGGFPKGLCACAKDESETFSKTLRAGVALNKDCLFRPWFRSLPHRRQTGETTRLGGTFAMIFTRAREKG